MLSKPMGRLLSPRRRTATQRFVASPEAGLEIQLPALSLMDLGAVGKFLTLFIAYFPNLQHREDTSSLYKILTKISYVLSTIQMSARQMLPFVLQMWKLKPKIMQPAHSTIEANPSLRVPGRLDKQRRWWWGVGLAFWRAPWPPKVHLSSMHHLRGPAHRRPSINVC